MTTQTQPRRFTVAEYYAMAEAGILKKEERIDLLDGLIIDPSFVISNLHTAVVTRLNMFFIRELGRRAISSVRRTIALDEYNAPESDLVLLQEREDFYASKTPVPEDTLLVIEVADDAADYDRREKLPRYAGAGIPEVWLVVLPEGVVEVYTEPAPAHREYRLRRILAPGNTIGPGCFPDITVPVNQILPG